MHYFFVSLVCTNYLFVKKCLLHCLELSVASSLRKPFYRHSAESVDLVVSKKKQAKRTHKNGSHMHSQSIFYVAPCSTVASNCSFV